MPPVVARSRRKTFQAAGNCCGVTAAADRVPRLDSHGRCPLCEAIDAGLDANVGSVVEDMTERVLELVLCYLNPDDVREMVDTLASEMEP
jgi:hypothetical protein